MTKGLFRKVKASEEDKHLIRTLRSSLSVNETQHQLKMISDDEYIETLKDIMKKVKMLEEKYDL